MATACLGMAQGTPDPSVVHPAGPRRWLTLVPSAGLAAVALGLGIGIPHGLSNLLSGRTNHWRSAVSSPTFPVVLRNGEAVRLGELRALPMTEFRAGILGDVERGARVSAFFAVPDYESSQLHALLADGGAGEFRWWATRIGDEYPALTPECPQFHWFERELFEQWEILPKGHPWLKPIRFHRSYRSRGTDEILPSVTDFFSIKGEEIHEVAVGPVHAGVIEPGHFRFQCHGEQVFHLEISLGLSASRHRAGTAGRTGQADHPRRRDPRGRHEVGHATAYCQAVEALCWCPAIRESDVLEAIALELERLANHTGDLGALANDVGLPSRRRSYCGRIRGDFLNITALLCGNRFGRRMVRPGGIGVGIGRETVAELSKRLDQAFDRCPECNRFAVADSVGQGSIRERRPGIGRSGG